MLAAVTISWACCLFSVAGSLPFDFMEYGSLEYCLQKVRICLLGSEIIVPFVQHYAHTNTIIKSFLYVDNIFLLRFKLQSALKTCPFWFSCSREFMSLNPSRSVQYTEIIILYFQRDVFRVVDFSFSTWLDLVLQKIFSSRWDCCNCQRVRSDCV